MSNRGERIVFLLCLFGCASAARGQTQVLDFDALGGTLGIGLVSRDLTEFQYTRIVAGSDPNTLHAASLTNPGASRQIPTAGIDVNQFRLDRFGSRGVVTDSVNSGVFSVDFVGAGAPIPLSVEPGTSGLLAMPNGQVAMLVRGTATSANAADRDQLYTRSILGGPATEILGGIPQLRQVTEVQFAADGGTIMVGTRQFNDNTIPQTTKVFLATPGATGLTPVLTSLSASTRFIPLGSDSAGDHFAFVADTFVTDLWSVSINNPAQSTRLNIDSQGETVYFDDWMIDTPGDRAFFTSFENNVPDFPWAIWSVPLDGSSPAEILGRLPTGQSDINLQNVIGESWLYVHTNTGATSAESRVYAISLDGGPQVEFREPGHVDATQLLISPDGESVIFSDSRTAGNDLYLGRPGASVTPQVTLLDVPNTDRLVRTEFSRDGKFAIVALASASLGPGLADRIVVVPVDGGPPVTIDDGTVGPVTAVFDNNGAYRVRAVADHRVFYLKAYSDGQIGFYVADLPTEIAGDYNGDGHVDAADYTVWRNSFGQNGDGLAADGNGDETVDQFDYAIWKSNFGSANGGGAMVGEAAGSEGVPEPGAVGLIAGMVFYWSLKRPVRCGSLAER
jgi:hypothetical protein